MSHAQGVLDGRWVQECSSGFQRTELIDGMRAQLTETSFSDQFCETEQVSILSSGSIYLGGAVQTPKGAFEINFTFEKVELIPKTQQLVARFNEAHLCGFSEWAISTPIEITSLQCDLFGTGQLVQIPRAGTKRFGIYKIEQFENSRAEKLYFGKLTPKENAQSEATRPTSLDLRFYLKGLQS